MGVIRCYQINDILCGSSAGNPPIFHPLAGSMSPHSARAALWPRSQSVFKPFWKTFGGWAATAWRWSGPFGKRCWIWEAT